MIALPTRALRQAAALAGAAWLLAACVVVHDGGDGAEQDVATRDSGGVRIKLNGSTPRTGARAGLGQPTFAEGDDGSVSIHTRNGAMVMAVRHDSVVIAFSDSVRETVKTEVRQKMAKDTANSPANHSALGQVIKGVVQSSVAGALSEVFDKARGFPVSALRTVSYEQGAIRFDFIEKPTWSFDGIETDGEPLLSQFHPADAARFVGAVRAKMKR